MVDSNGDEPLESYGPWIQVSLHKGEPSLFPSTVILPDVVNCPSSLEHKTRHR